MKNYILLVVSAVALAFTSCSDSEEIDIKYQVSIAMFSEEQIYCFSSLLMYK